MQQAAALTLSSPLNVPRMLAPNHFPKPTCFASIKPLNALAVNYSSPIPVKQLVEITVWRTYIPKSNWKQPKRHIIFGREAVDKEYVDYTTDHKTVLLGEACDVLEGEFCEPAQMGIC